MTVAKNQFQLDVVWGKWLRLLLVCSGGCGYGYCCAVVVKVTGWWWLLLRGDGKSSSDGTARHGIIHNEQASKQATIQPFKQPFNHSSEQPFKMSSEPVNKKARTEVGKMEYTVKDGTDKMVGEMRTGEIGYEEFKKDMTIHILKLGRGVTRVGMSAFQGSGVEMIDAREAVDVVFEEKCFSDCAALKKVKLPAVDVPADCFSGCRHLETVEFETGEDDGKLTVGERAFAMCLRLRAVKNMPPWMVLESGAFMHCADLTGIFSVGGTNQTSVPPSIFQGCASIAGLTVLEGTVTLGEMICADCISLCSVELPASLQLICREAFYRCGALETVETGRDLIIVSDSAFRWCARLRSITFESKKGVYFGERAFADCAALETFTVPPMTVQLSHFVFARCVSLHTVHLNGKLRKLCPGCFEGCQRLTTCAVGGEKELTEIGSDCFQGTALTEMCLKECPLKVISGRAFSCMTQLRVLELPPTLQELGIGMCEHCPELEAITIPASVETIPRQCFYNCEKLATVQVQVEDGDIDSTAFSGCSSLTDMQLTGNTPWDPKWTK